MPATLEFTSFKLTVVDNVLGVSCEYGDANYYFVEIWVYDWKQGTLLVVSE